jgi:hypothetical protein
LVETEARQAAYRELASWLETGRGAARDQQRMLLLAAVKEREKGRGLFVWRRTSRSPNSTAAVKEREKGRGLFG